MFRLGSLTFLGPMDFPKLNLSESSFGCVHRAVWKLLALNLQAGLLVRQRFLTQAVTCPLSGTAAAHLYVRGAFKFHMIDAL